MVYRYILLLCFFFVCTASFAQSLFLPYDVGDKREGKINSDQIDFYAYPFKGESIDLRDFKRKNPKLKAPNFLKLDLEGLNLNINITVLIGLIKGVEPNKNALVIWLASDFETEEITFYLDKNLDRNFNTELEVITLNSKDEAYTVTITPEKGGIPNQQLSLKVPKRKPVKVNIPKQNSKIINDFSIGVHAGVGIGKLFYQYDNTEIGFPTWYNISFTEKYIGTSVSYNLYRFRFTLAGSYQNVFSYTSYLNIRLDEPEIVIHPTQGRVVRENVQVERNFDRHTKHRFQYGASLAYRFHVSKGSEIQPFVTIGQTYHSPNKYTGNRFDDQSYDLPPVSYIQLGIRYEFVVGSNQTFYLDVAFQKSQWRPKDFFEPIPYQNLEIDNRDWKMTFGYRLGL